MKFWTSRATKFEFASLVTQLEANLELTFADLVRLSTLSRDLMLRKENKKAISIQAVGYRTVVYFVEETSPDVTTMIEILSFDVPNTICGLGDLINKMDQLKEVCHIFHTGCQPRYKYPTPLTDNTEVAIDPSVASQEHPFSLCFKTLLLFFSLSLLYLKKINDANGRDTSNNANMDSSLS